MIKLKEMLIPKYVYHVTDRNRLEKIKIEGIIPQIPADFEGEEKAVYLFDSLESVEDAMVSWLGDRFEDGEDVFLLTISTEGLNIVATSLSWELKSYDIIPVSSIVKTELI